jgi:hypothetical protein
MTHVADTSPARAVPRWRTLRDHRLVRTAVRVLAIGWIVFFWIWLNGVQSTFVEVDAEAYWGIDLGSLYQGVRLGDQDAFLYSPVVAALFAPFSLLPYEVFYGILAAVNLAALVWLLGWELAAVSLFAVPVSNEIARGNIHLLLAAAIVVGFRRPAAWAWVLLTKVTPGIGLAWFAFRREWRQLFVALGVTGVVVAASFVIAPGLWTGWIGMLAENAESTRPSLFQVPVLPRLLAATVLLGLGAWRERPAIVPVAAMLALPAIWVNSLAMLVAVIPLWRNPDDLAIRPVRSRT